MKYWLLIPLCMLIAVPSFARDSLFHGVWGSDSDAFAYFWGNLKVTPKKIYWGRVKGTALVSTSETYLCSSDYEVVRRGKDLKYPAESHSVLKNKVSEHPHIFNKYKLTNLECKNEQSASRYRVEKYGYLLLVTSYRSRSGGYGRGVSIDVYDSNNNYWQSFIANKVRHLVKDEI